MHARRTIALARSLTTHGLRAVVASTIVVTIGCSPSSAPMSTGFGAASSAPLVMPAANDQQRAAEIDAAVASLDGRLDSTLGAPARNRVDTDVTIVGVVDRQFSWNGRVFDSYNNTRRTVRRIAE